MRVAKNLEFDSLGRKLEKPTKKNSHMLRNEILFRYKKSITLKKSLICLTKVIINVALQYLFNVALLFKTIFYLEFNFILKID